jgi:hypothetical protein
MSRRRDYHYSGPIRDALRARVADAYREGATIRGLMADTGYSFGKIYRLLIESGVPMRPRGGFHGRHRRTDEPS